MKVILASCVICVIFALGDGKTCITANDCSSIPSGATKQCVAGLCTCLKNFLASNTGCNLNIMRPTLFLTGSQQLANGGDYKMTCKSSLTTDELSNAIEYRLHHNNKHIQTATGTNTFVLKDVDDEDAGTYECLHSYLGQWTRKSDVLRVVIVEAGKLCSRSSVCGTSNGYSGQCDPSKQRCKCTDKYSRKGNACVADGALQMVASVALVMLSAVISRLF